jgi:pimeloyl-ACP methyl ester carboxylesterase
MKCVYKSQEGEKLVQERYRKFLDRWPIPNQQFHVPTREGETFVVSCGNACGDEAAPPLLLLHGAVANAVTWMRDAPAWAAHFRVYAVDLIGEPGLSAPSRPPLGSEAHALWLDDVMQALSLKSASIVGMSLGGWLALDYATRRPDRVTSLVLLCPGGVGRQKIGILLKAAGLRMCGRWGEGKLREIVLGWVPAGAPPALQRVFEFLTLILDNFRPRRDRLPRFSDDALERLTMPVMAILGGKDVLLDSSETKRRLERTVPHAEIRFLPEVGHLIPGQTEPILEFLRAATKADHPSYR